MSTDKPGLLYVDRVVRGVNVWVGPFGLHLFWPDVWKSRLGFCRPWRQPLD